MALGFEFEEKEIPTDLPWDPPGSELRDKLAAAYEECGENCVYLDHKERDWQDHDASTALYVLRSGVTAQGRVDIPGLRDVIRNAFQDHTNDARFRGFPQHCFEGNPGYGEERAIIALQALWKFGPRVLEEIPESQPIE